MKHACLPSLHHIPCAMNIAIVASYCSCTRASNGYVQEKRTIMMDNVFIYHAHPFFSLFCACVGYLEFLLTSTSRELTIRALESEPPSTTTILHRTCLYFGIVKDAQGHTFKVIYFSFENPQSISMNIAIVASYYYALLLLMVMCKRREPSRWMMCLSTMHIRSLFCCVHV